MHLLRDGQVCIPQMAWLHPELRRFLPALEAVASRVVDQDYAIPDPNAFSDEERVAVQWLLSWPSPVTGIAWCLPFFSEEYCDKLLAEVQDMKHTPNDEEEEAFQIPEIVLEYHCPALFASMSVLKRRVLDVYSVLLMGTVADHIRSIQFACYSDQHTSHGNWHNDLDSDVTAVVSLNPEAFTGGGTDLRVTAFKSVLVDPLPKGYCLLFNGKHTLHRGRRVLSGRRDLLVFWSEVK